VGFILDNVALIVSGFSPSNSGLPCWDHSVILHTRVRLSAIDA